MIESGGEHQLTGQTFGHLLGEANYLVTFKYVFLLIILGDLIFLLLNSLSIYLIFILLILNCKTYKVLLSHYSIIAGN